MKGLRDKLLMGQKGGGRNRWGPETTINRRNHSLDEIYR